MFLLSSRENNPETVHHRPEEASGRLPAEVFFLAAVASSIGVMADSNFSSMAGVTPHHITSNGVIWQQTGPMHCGRYAVWYNATGHESHCND